MSKPIFCGFLWGYPGMNEPVLMYIGQFWGFFAHPHIGSGNINGHESQDSNFQRKIWRKDEAAIDLCDGL
jgi:hypothetical protein